MTAIKLLLVSIVLLVSVECYIVNPGPTVIATKGEVWPKPQLQDKYDTYFVLRPQLFQFKVITDNECNLLLNAFSRYHRIISNSHQRRTKNTFDINLYYKKVWLNDENYLGYLDTLEVYLLGPCEDDAYPTFNVDEEYLLVISNDSFQLTSNTTWGILRGLETFSQLIYLGSDSVALRVNSTAIVDYPRFSHRGLLLDTSRHYISLDQILLTLDAMAYNKLNVFHWHITDDQSFPYVSRKFPELSEKGAYASSLVYTPADVKEIIEYARIRGIRVLPEFDTPGHTRSWGEANRALLTECYNGEIKTGDLGPIDPSNDDVYPFLQDLFEEIEEVFPDQYVHLGGDEVDFDCWKSNPNITEFMKSKNITDNYASLESYYIQKLINIVDKLNYSSIVWEEVFVNGVGLPTQTLVHVWRDNWELTIYEATHAGRPTLLSSCWYLDHLMTGGDWQKFYFCDPYDFVGTAEQKKLVLGGEACMWSESVNDYNVLSRVWPRASATAERLWSSSNVTDINDAAKRLEEHTCRMNSRGISAEPPNSAGYCL